MIYDNEFENSLSVGKRGEKKVIAALTARGHIVEDFSDVYEWRRIDTDLRLTSKSGSITTLEVKNDIKSNYTGNVYVELTNKNNDSRNYDGWYYYCEA